MGEEMYPIIDIPPSSPSLKRTQREANFLSRNCSPEPNDPKIEGNSSPWIKNWTMVVAGSVSFFDVWRRKEKNPR